MTLCASCGTDLPPRMPGKGRPRIYCSSLCAQRSRRGVGERNADCADCGASFTAGRRGPMPTSCPDCRSGLTARKGATCVECGEAFTATTTAQRYCSARCRTAKLRKGGIGRVTRACEHCATDMLDVHPFTRFCSDRCCRKFNESRLSSDERAARWERKRANWQRRRAMKRGATVGPRFTIHNVIERDGWDCSLCGALIDPGVRYPDPMSLSLDHVIPLNRGGEHSLANAAAAHLVCNVTKGDRMEAC